MIRRTHLIAAAALALSAALAPSAGAQDYEALLLQALRSHDALTLQSIQMLRQHADAKTQEALRQRMLEPSTRAAHALYVKQMRAAGRVPLDFADFVFASLADTPRARFEQEERMHPGERAARSTSSARPGDSRSDAPPAVPAK